MHQEVPHKGQPQGLVQWRRHSRRSGQVCSDAGGRCTGVDAREEVTFQNQLLCVPRCGCRSCRIETFFFSFFLSEKVLEKIFFNKMLWGM